MNEQKRRRYIIKMYHGANNELKIVDTREPAFVAILISEGPVVVD